MLNSRSFPVIGPSLWNRLPPASRNTILSSESRLLLSVASTSHCHSFAYSICNLHPCARLCCKQAGLLLLALRWPPCLSTGVLGSGPAFCCPPNWWHT